jgi:hypothetical protein
MINTYYFNNITNLISEYIGCYIDTLTRDLPYQVNPASGYFTIERCLMNCRNIGYKYAGLQAG